ncbi:hypothetical protein DRP04_13115, partial [Archaeoglobales archaeon]
GCGSIYVTINEDGEGLAEVFVKLGRSGGCGASQTEAIGRLVSLALRSGIDPEEIIKQLKGIRCPFTTWHDGVAITSCADAVAKVLEAYLKGELGRPSASGLRKLSEFTDEVGEWGKEAEIEESEEIEEPETETEEEKESTEEVSQDTSSN